VVLEEVLGVVSVMVVRGDTLALKGIRVEEGVLEAVVEKYYL